MFNRRDPNKAVDVSIKLPVVRSFADIPQFAKDPAAASESLKLLSVVKKSFNIPICDVKLDPDYDTFVKSTFRLPASYLRHVRRIGDEADVSIDYNVEQEDKAWIASLAGGRVATDKELRLLSAEAFEAIINLLERHTGQSRDPIPQACLAPLPSHASIRRAFPVHCLRPPPSPALLLPPVPPYKTPIFLHDPNRTPTLHQNKLRRRTPTD